MAKEDGDSCSCACCDSEQIRYGLPISFFNNIIQSLIFLFYFSLYINQKKADFIYTYDFEKKNNASTYYNNSSNNINDNIKKQN